MTLVLSSGTIGDKGVLIMSSNLIRKNVFVSPEVNEWLQKESQATGLSQASIILFALLTYIKQQETPVMVDKLMEMFEELKRNNQI